MKAHAMIIRNRQVVFLDANGGEIPYDSLCAEDRALLNSDDDEFEVEDDLEEIDDSLFEEGIDWGWDPQDILEVC